MIGVIPRANEVTVVEEFFQLFKTPWELYREGGSYDVIIATADEVPDVDARLLVIYASEPRNLDTQAKATAHARLRDVALDYEGNQVPVYGEVLTFEETDACALRLASGAGIAGVEI